ncbi:MAG: hypothetical protein AAF732_16180 [Pseudomonadota bacterium]
MAQIFAVKLLAARLSVAVLFLVLALVHPARAENPTLRHYNAVPIGQWVGMTPAQKASLSAMIAGSSNKYITLPLMGCMGDFARDPQFEMLSVRTALIVCNILVRRGPMS